MTHHVALHFAAKTDTGLVRAHNEDAIEINEEYGIVVLADGMGGYNAGEVASGIATSAFRSRLEVRLQEINASNRSPSSKVLQRLMVDAVNTANQQIMEAAFNQPEFSGMGTTLVAALFHQNQIVLAHVGDSRAYRFRQGMLFQLTHDHSQLQEQIDAGLVSPEWARFAPNKNLITRALGVMPQIDVETSIHLVEQGDVYLLCSDGLSDMLSGEQMAELLNLSTDIESACKHLVETANNNGGRDNISVILSKIESVKATVPFRMLDRLMSWLK
jgi:serine/threonine protein phosphatase PrpC